MSLTAISGIYNYNPISYDYREEANKPENESLYLRKNHNELNENNDMLGSAKTDIAKKGFKYIFKRVKNFITKLIKGDKETTEKVLDFYDKGSRIHDVITRIDEINNNTEKKNTYHCMYA